MSDLIKDLPPDKLKQHLEQEARLEELNRTLDFFWDEGRESDKVLRAFKENRIKELSNQPKVTRVEVIDDSGRAYTKWSDNLDVQLSYQDDGRTLKVFIKERLGDE